ncbi:MAG: ROK family protein [Oscillospiraceae bacterium]|nr:ROK family protein [Oscillospiraceae bacterium]MCL2279838.1 ROK family protein [Oscillospiraceae bacterium]
MKHCGIDVEVKNKPELDPEFIPLFKFNEAFLKTAKAEFSVAIEKDDKQINVISTFIHGDEAHREADRYYVDRLVKTALWQIGGYKIHLKGDDNICSWLKAAYSKGGSRAFDADFYGMLYDQNFEVVQCEKLPDAYEIREPRGGHFDGCRIGADFGGSDYKVSALVDGEVIYSNETVWNPKLNDDPSYHYNGIISAFREAKEKLPRVDAVGISSAGLVGNNRVLYAQLYQMVPKDRFKAEVRDIWSRAVREVCGDVPFAVLNDGDITALAGSINLKKKNMLGIAMGTSVAGGYVDKNGYVSNWLSELAFIPLDASPKAAMDVWTEDIGVGVSYFCQEAVVKLAPAAGISLDEHSTPAKKLKVVQNLLADGHEGAAAVFRSIGVYLGHSAVLYNSLFDGASSILLLGRVMSGKGGDIILETANFVLKDEYPNVSVELLLPDEQTRRLGQSVVAASLPKITEQK